MAAFEHKIVNKASGLCTLRSDWEKLTSKIGDARVPITWHWHYAWWNNFSTPTSVLQVHQFSRGGQTVAIAPMYKTTSRIHGFSIRTTKAMSNDHSPYFDFLFSPELQESDRDQIISKVFQACEATLVCFEKLAEDSYVYKWLSRVDRTIGWHGITDRKRVPLIDTSGSWDAYFSSRSKKFRKNLQKKLRDFEAAPRSSIECVLLKSSEDSAFDEIVQVSEQSWKTKINRSLRADATARRFLGDLVNLIGAAGGCEAWIAKLDGSAIAFELHFRRGSVTYPIRADMDEKHRNLSPGSVVEFHALRAAFESPHTRLYDTCADNYFYLRNLANQERRIVDLKVYPPTLTARALYALEHKAKPFGRLVRDRMAGWSRFGRLVE